jgi:hypothetical protein
VKKVIAMVVLGIGGLAAAIGLTVGALALAGDVGTVVQPRLTQSRSAEDATSPSQEDRSETPSPSVDDHGGGSDDPPGDNSGPGSDNSGSGSDNSGSGSDNSGSDSDNSGSGSGNSGSDDD